MRALVQELALTARLLAGPVWMPAEVPAGSVYVVLSPDWILAIPPGRLPYFPAGLTLKEPPAKPFLDLEAQEFGAQNPAKALEMAGTLAASPDPVLRAGELVKGVADEFRAEVSARGFSVECDPDSAAHPVDADPEALARAVHNLLDNAAKYSGTARSITITVRRAGGSVSIAVRDQGIGIPAAEQKRIFRKFVRGAAAGAQGVPGTGIGLAMVRHIVEAHGGSVGVASAPGEGSTFTIALRGVDYGTHTGCGRRTGHRPRAAGGPRAAGPSS